MYVEQSLIIIKTGITITQHCDSSKSMMASGYWYNNVGIASWQVMISLTRCSRIQGGWPVIITGYALAIFQSGGSYGPQY